MIERRFIRLGNGQTLRVAFAGEAGAPPLLLLHGFPESHRTWTRVAGLLADRFRLIMPDQRGFGGSDAPQGAEAYRAGRLVEDVTALLDALGIARVGLVGHDWGGAIAWAVAMLAPERVERLAIVNAPHPGIFQRSLWLDRDQRAASQYIRRFRESDMADRIAAMGHDRFFGKSYAAHGMEDRFSDEERAAIVTEWAEPGRMQAMLNWYVASTIDVPAMDAPYEEPPPPHRPLPRLAMPVHLIWAMDDRALLPCQIEGIDDIGDRVTVERLDGVGHFAPMEAPERVAAALARAFSA